ncbi:hypothetical protein FJ251_10775 [bacterium]|nr:hypothetical protein [bacterium]
MTRSAGSIRQLAYATPLLFVGSHRIDDWALQLLIFNLSDPLRPLPLGGLLWPEHEDREIEAILPVEDTLYLTIEDFGLVTIDISDPTEPAVIAEVPLGHSGEMQMVDDVLVIAAGEPGVVLLDVADAANPAVLGTLQTVEAQGIAVRDGLLYVADGMGGMEVINIADPSMPRRLHITSFADESQDIELFGDVAVLAQRDQGIRAVDIADPLDWQRILPSTPTETVWRFSREGDRLLTISGQPDPGWLRVYDLSDPLNAVPIMQYPVHKNRAVFADGLLASAGSSVCIAAQTPTALAPILGSLSHPGEAYVSACFSGGFLFVAGTGGVHVIDASEVSTFQVLTTLLPGKRCFGIATDGERVYVPVQREGLHVLDISDPFAAELVGYVDIPLRLGGIALQEQVCALIVESSSIRLYDVSRPERIKELGAIEVADHLRELDFRSGGVLAVAADSDGLILVDCSTPTAPTIAGSFDRPYKEVDVAVQGDLAFTLNQHLGLAILDISEANIPHLVGSAALPSSAYGFDVADGYAFIACNYDGTQILDAAWRSKRS